MQRGRRKRPALTEKGEPKYAFDSPQLRRSAMGSNNMITPPDQEPSSQQSALKKKVSRKYAPAHLAHACFLMQRSSP